MPRQHFLHRPNLDLVVTAARVHVLCGVWWRCGSPLPYGALSQPLEAQALVVAVALLGDAATRGAVTITGAKEMRLLGPVLQNREHECQRRAGEQDSTMIDSIKKYSMQTDSVKIDSMELDSISDEDRQTDSMSLCNIMLHNVKIDRQRQDRQHEARHAVFLQHRHAVFLQHASR